MRARGPSRRRRRLAALMRAYAQAASGQIHYRHERDSGFTIVLFHEAPLSSAVYEPALPLLAGGFAPSTG